MHDHIAKLKDDPRTQGAKTSLRFVIGGSVVAGKSTLTGRLLSEGQRQDRLDSRRTESVRTGAEGVLGFAQESDGLAAERGQSVDIDIGYRVFATDKRAFIVADTPSDGRDLCNFATAASTADVAVIVVDVATSKDLPTQAWRHTYIATMLGVRHLVLAVNKIDLVGFDRETFEVLAGKYRAFAHELGVDDVQCIPLSAMQGDNVRDVSGRMPWYSGPALLPYLETVEVTNAAQVRPFRMPVQEVDGRSPDFCGLAGTVAGGLVHQGDRVKVLPSAEEAQVARIVTKDGDLDTAVTGQSVTVVLDREVDISRGDVLCDADEPVAIADQFAAHLLWMSPDALLPGRTYLIKIGTATAQASVSALKHKVNINTLEHVAARTLQLNEIGVCNLSLDKAIPFEPYADNRDLGAFILIDRITHQTVGLGLIDFALRRATNVHWQSLQVSRETRAEQKGQRPAVIWFTGLSGSGKSTIATALEKRLYGLGRHTYVLDGDNVRHGLNRDLGFTDADRVENIRRVAEVARLLADAGLIVLVSFISPFRSEREMARALMQSGEFIEVFVDAPLQVCETRDPKGLYRKARRNEIKNFTGIDSPYEPPEAPELRLQSNQLEPEQAVDIVLDYLRDRGLTNPS